jgi:hypothetical protein
MVLGAYLLAASACTERSWEEPEIKLEDSLVVRILTDSYILNAAFNQTFGTIKDSVSLVYSKQVLGKYGVSAEVLDANLLYLSHDPMKMDTIYQGMLDRLDELEVVFTRAEGDP